ncbi:hypothetical protein [Gloeothece verrucosa]|uniref:O-linked N-acetylglucosamine transferase SPINDLY family-like protein n=1 Tax=Gloeothece verrucosa (strain PCC 7822) TaxID=497965 RepID=E0U7R9_GLOV7|nr:hypothetical protein [Gloeothece verrucosa]ADN14881.1 O-linked N-acetylglucosamine transferase SPINDLY family-like protein [Gloeothece verrucosa PCC 7822]
MIWHPQAYQSLINGDYSLVQQFYEQLIEAEPENASHYWYLGLAYLLTRQEPEAQATWLLAMSQGEEQEQQEWTSQLIEILDSEAQRQQEQENYQLSWLIRAHLREIVPTLINNLLNLIHLEICLNCYSPKHLEDWDVVEILQSTPTETLNTDLLLQVLSEVLEFPALLTVAFVKASQHHIRKFDIFFTTVNQVVLKIAYDRLQAAYAADLTEICLEAQPDNIYLVDQLFWFNFMAKRYPQARKAAEKFYQQAESLSLKVFGQYKLLQILLHSGAWLETQSMTKDYIASLQQMLKAGLESIDSVVKAALQGMAMPLYYLQDNPRENRALQNQLSRLFQDNVQNLQGMPNRIEVKRLQPHRLKIGYIAHTLRRHSVGWLSRWLLHYRNRDSFEVALYLVNQPEDELTEAWFRQKADLTYNFSNERAIALQIEKDEIDILVDLDSITNVITCQVMALKPAPLQVTWLGLDGSGVPAIDYYIADDYVLPQEAQDYYHEKIWRLPHCYLAVDGFESGVPTLRREHLNIPSEAIIYLSVQTGLKRHPDTIRLQMKVLKEVPNSYLLVKGAGQTEKIEQLFLSIASEEGVSPNRIRFLSTVASEEIHRANLTIADVVLDTFPYNGATTTLEVLWMGIPLVTRVGQQFAARNSYTFMIHAGLTEGIAWTDEEYIQWGIKLGTDERLRQQIAWKLKNGRKTAPLWNAQQFTRDMENAYQQMWAKFNT